MTAPFTDACHATSDTGGTAVMDPPTGAFSNHHRRDFKALEERRYQALRLLEQGLKPAAVAREVGATCQSVCRWRDLAALKGRDGLVSAGRAGRKPKITPAQVAEVGAALQQGPRAFGIDHDLWTLPDLAKVIERLCGVSYRPTGVWYLLDRMGWNLRRVERKAMPETMLALEPRAWTSTGPFGMQMTASHW